MHTLLVSDGLALNLVLKWIKVCRHFWIKAEWKKRSIWGTAAAETAHQPLLYDSDRYKKLLPRLPVSLVNIRLVLAAIQFFSFQVCPYHNRPAFPVLVIRLELFFLLVVSLILIVTRWRNWLVFNKSLINLWAPLYVEFLTLIFYYP